MPNDSAVFDFLKFSMGFESDTQLAAWLGISRDSLSGIRTGRLPMGDSIRFVILTKWWSELRHRPNAVNTPVQASGALEQVVRTPTGFCSKALLGTVNAHLKVLGKDACGSDHKSVDGELLDAYKVLKGCSTDTDLASLLGIKRQSISMVRSGRNDLGPIPLLKIFEDVTDQHELGLQAAVQSSEAMMNLFTLSKATDTRDSV
jgi:DNA-binding Xre family transcriptional regulator